MNVRHLLRERFTAAFQAAGADGAEPAIQPAAKAGLGDYQANGAMAAAKRLHKNPRELAELVVGQAKVEDLAGKLEVAGPGFINIRLSDAFLSKRVDTATALVDPVAQSQRVVVDYSSPNLAKEMHVGHLRSTIIGDALARVLEKLGHEVIRQNHVGDWGTQFGMLLAHLEDVDGDSDELADLENFYRAAKAQFDSDPEFAERSRGKVVSLQAGDPAIRAQWQKFIEISLTHCQQTYDRLGVTLEMTDVMAESAYNDELPDIIDKLRAADLLTESDGAQCVFLDEFTGKDDKPLPVIVQKSDGGYLYSTTDLAAVRLRARDLKIDRALYLTDARQSLHFKQIFAVARKAGFCDEALALEHHPFGNMLGKDGKPFKTREGGVIKLNELLDEAEARALALVSEKNPDLEAAERIEIARVVGIGAVKYADLSKNRTSDYIFDWDQMLSFEGNTSPYLQYAYSRIQSIFRRGGIDAEKLTAVVSLDSPEERALAVNLVRFQEVLEQVAQDGFPHFLCTYLFGLATSFMRFYEACPILNADDPVKASRALLCQRTAQTLQEGLSLLGIGTVERM